jgi:PhnB protein
MMRPDRYHDAVVPHIYVAGASDAIAFYKKAFGAQELFRVAGKDGKIVHGEVAICGSVFMIGDPGTSGLYGDPRKLGGCTAGLHVMVDDNEALLRRATAAGAEEVQAVTDMFYGASAGSVRDPFGHVWVLLSWKDNPDAAEIERRGAALLNQAAS